MSPYEIEKNIEHYKPSHDEIVLAEDALNLINVVCNCEARWSDYKEAYAHLPYGWAAMAIWEEKGEQYYTCAWAEINGTEVNVSVGINILEIVTKQVFYYDKPFEHGKIVNEVVDFDNLDKQDNTDKEVVEENNSEESIWIDVDSYEETSDDEEDDFDYDVFLHKTTFPKKETVEVQNNYVDEEYERYLQYQRNLQYARSFKEQFGTDSIEMNEEVAHTRYFFGG